MMKIRPTAPEAEALPRRREMLQGGEAIRGIVFQSVERALTRTLGADAVDEVKRAALLPGRSFDAMSKYPMVEFLNFEEEAAKRLAPVVGGFDEAVRQIGAGAVESFFDSIAGKTMALLAGKDPTRLLSAAPNGYGLLVTYGQRHWRQTSANTGVFRFEGEFLGPVHNLGSFDTALKLAHEVDAEFTLEVTGPLDFQFQLRW